MNSIWARLGLMVVLIVCSVSVGEAATWYVRPSSACSYNGDGTAYGCAATRGARGAWKGFSGLGALSAGDTVYICGSFAYADRRSSAHMLWLQYSGSEGNLITINGDCSANGDLGGAIIDGQNLGAAYAVSTYNSTYLTVKNLALKGVSSRGVFGYADENADQNIDKYVTYDNITVSDIVGAGHIAIDLRGRHLTVTNSTIKRIGSTGIFTVGSFFTATNNYVADVSLDDIVGNNIQMGTGAVDGSIIQNNYLDHQSRQTKQCIAITQTTDHGFVLISHNTCLKSVTDDVGVGIRVDTRSAIRRNRVMGGLYGIHCNAVVGQCDIVGNVVTSPSSIGIDVSTTAIANVLNNTISGGTTCIRNESTSKSFANKNNICQGQITGINNDSGAGPVDSNNLFWQVSGHAVVLGGSTPASPGPGTVTADPQFLSGTDFRTQTSSPTRRAGVPADICVDASDPSCDPGHPDIGACQGNEAPGGIGAEIPQMVASSNVQAAPASPAIGTSLTGLSFTAQARANPSSQTLTIRNVGGGTLSWSASDSATWLSLSPVSGLDTGVVRASVQTGTLVVGSYTGIITLTAPGAASASIPVTLTITPAPVPISSPLTHKRHRLIQKR